MMSNSEPDLGYTRLHITPLSPSLLTTILPASILSSARNISYHSLQTFPEKSYGYIDLPMADAEKIKKKLHGAILKGTKVRIEKARPEKEDVVEEDGPERVKKERKKRKRDQLEVPGIDIGERHVKRGWTIPSTEIKGNGKGKEKEKEKEKVAKSKFTTGPECLFKTVLPPNKVENAKGKLKKSKDKKKGKETLVHEFERTVKYATFLRAPGGKKSKGVVEFVEGKGWVGEDGNVVEVVKMRKGPAEVELKPAAKEELEVESSEESSDEEADEKEAELKIPNEVGHESEDNTSDDSLFEEELDSKAVESSMSSTKVDEESSEESSSEESSSEEQCDHVKVTATSQATKAASTSSESSEEESADEPEEPQSAITSRPQSSSGAGLSIKIPESMTSTPIASSVHPLEALYKQNPEEQPKAGPSFSFFGDNDEEDIAGETHLQVPLTPFTQKDFEYRGIRSAAPTPDTAHPNKRFVWPTDNDDEDDDEEARSPIREPKGKQKDTEAEPESDFQKWFWENRGDVNRAWKKRRKVVAKEKRQRENRKGQDRAI
jgi:hypothetical protein